MSVIAVTARPKELEAFLLGLSDAGKLKVDVETTGAATLKRIKAAPPRLVIIDRDLPDFEPLKLVVEVMMISAMTNTAVVTEMSEEDFHEASEGYGVLKGLPMHPTRENGVELAELLASI